MESIPRDVLCGVLASYLSFDEMLNLSSTCRTLRAGFIVGPSDLCCALEVLRHNGRPSIWDWSSVWPLVVKGASRRLFVDWALARLRNDFDPVRAVMNEQHNEPLVSALVRFLVGAKKMAPSSLLVTASHWNSAGLARSILVYAPGVNQSPAAFAAAMRDSIDVMMLLEVEASQWPKVLAHAYRYDSRHVMRLLICQRHVDATEALAYQYVQEEGRQFLQALLAEMVE